MNQVPSLDALPLSPFEAYMVADDRESYPMIIPIVCEFDGCAEVAPLKKAYVDALRWHPMLRSRLRRGRWEPCEPNDEGLEIVSEGSVEGSCDPAIDLREGPPMIARVILRRDSTTILTWLHHAVSDGVGNVEFLGDWLAHYADQLGALGRPLKSPDPSLLPKRALLDRTIPHPVSKRVVLQTLAKETLRFFFRRAEPVASHSPPTKDDPDRWRMVNRQISVAESLRLREAIAEANVTANDWAIASLMRAIATSNDSCRKAPSRGWIIANMPVLMRPKSARRISAANMIGYSFLARRRENLQEWSEAVESIAAESHEIQRWKMAGLFNDAVGMTQSIPGLLRLTTRSWIRPATFVLSNVGDPSKRFRRRFPIGADGYPVIANLVFRRFSGTAPLRPGTEVAALFHTLGGRFTFCIRTHPHRLSAADSDALLDSWIRETLANT